MAALALPPHTLDAELHAKFSTLEIDFLRAIAEGPPATEAFLAHYRHVRDQLFAATKAGLSNLKTNVFMATAAQRMRILTQAFLSYEQDAHRVRERMDDDIARIFREDRTTHAKRKGKGSKSKGTISSKSQPPHKPDPTGPKVDFKRFRPCRDYFLEHFNSPFPSAADKATLASQITDGSVKSVNLWFTNIRRRSGWGDILKQYARNDKHVMKLLINAVLDPSSAPRPVPDHIKKAVFTTKSYVEKLAVEIYSAAWANFRNVKPLTHQQWLEYEQKRMAERRDRMRAKRNAKKAEEAKEKKKERRARMVQRIAAAEAYAQQLGYNVPVAVVGVKRKRADEDVSSTTPDAGHQSKRRCMPISEAALAVGALDRDVRFVRDEQTGLMRKLVRYGAPKSMSRRNRRGKARSQTPPSSTTKGKGKFDGLPRLWPTHLLSKTSTPTSFSYTAPAPSFTNMPQNNTITPLHVSKKRKVVEMTSSASTTSHEPTVIALEAASQPVPRLPSTLANKRRKVQARPPTNSSSAKGKQSTPSKPGRALSTPVASSSTPVADTLPRSVSTPDTIEFQQPSLLSTDDSLFDDASTFGWVQEAQRAAQPSSLSIPANTSTSDPFSQLLLTGDLSWMQTVTPSSFPQQHDFVDYLHGLDAATQSSVPLVEEPLMDSLFDGSSDFALFGMGLSAGPAYNPAPRSVSNPTLATTLARPSTKRQIHSAPSQKAALSINASTIPISSPALDALLMPPPSVLPSKPLSPSKHTPKTLKTLPRHSPYANARPDSSGEDAVAKAARFEAKKKAIEEARRKLAELEAELDDE